MNLPDVFSLVALSITPTIPLTPSSTATGAVPSPAVVAACVPSLYISQFIIRLLIPQLTSVCNQPGLMTKAIKPGFSA